MKVKIYQDICSDITNIIFYEEKDGKRYIVKPVELVLEEVKDGMRTDPTLSIPGMMARGFLKSLAEELDSKGIKTDKDAKIEGTLEATKYHLEDMRKILKIK